MSIVHYSSYMVNGSEVYGTAELLCGSGYLFRAEGERQATLVSYKDVDLMLYDRVDLAEAQAQADGDKVYRTSRTLQARAA
jgi:hypothetical protein